jgi:hypothetical protein
VRTSSVNRLFVEIEHWSCNHATPVLGVAIIVLMENKEVDCVRSNLHSVINTMGAWPQFLNKFLSLSLREPGFLSRTENMKPEFLNFLLSTADCKHTGKVIFSESLHFLNKSSTIS